MHEIDVWRTAYLLMREYALEAALIASTRADALLAQGDLKGFAVWKRVVAAIADLERDKPRNGEAIN